MVTFVMPAYNAEKFIDKAVRSVKAQSDDRWKLIIVEDGSSDSTLALAEQFSAEDERISVIKMENNSGCAHIPRMVGMMAAETEFVSQLDADDWIDPEYVEQLLRKQKETDADAVLAVMYAAPSGKRVCPSREFMKEIGCVSGKELVEHTMPKWEISLAGGIIRKEVIEKTIRNSEQYIDTTNIFCDEMFSRCMLMELKRVAFAEAIYYYRLNGNSVTHLNERKLDYIKHQQRVTSMVRERCGENSKASLNAEIRLFHSFFEMMRAFREIDNSRKDNEWREKRKKYYSELKDMWKSIDRERISGKVSSKYMALYRTGFGGVRLLLPLLDKIMSK